MKTVMRTAWRRICASGALALLTVASWPIHATAGTMAAKPRWPSSPRTALICDLAETTSPDCFKPRAVPVVKVLLVHYGNAGATTATARAGALLQQRFGESLDQLLTIQFTDTVVMPLAQYPRDTSELESALPGPPSMRTPERLERIWYYYHRDYLELVDEIQARLIANGHGPALADSDAVLVLSEPQFEALGYATGGYGLTEQPSEVAWMASDGGRTELQTDERLVDELLHELGHVLGLDHASAQCFLDTVTGMDRVKCCNASPGRSDVMSYCRDRSGVQGPYYYRYASCTKQYLTDTVIPLLLHGGNREFQASNCL